MYQKIVHRREANEMENCGNSPKHIRIIWVDYNDMLRVDFPIKQEVLKPSGLLSLSKTTANHCFRKHQHSARRSIEERLQN